MSVERFQSQHMWNLWRFWISTQYFYLLGRSCQCPMAWYMQAVAIERPKLHHIMMLLLLEQVKTTDVCWPWRKMCPCTRPLKLHHVLQECLASGSKSTHTFTSRPLQLWKCGSESLWWNIATDNSKFQICTTLVSIVIVLHYLCKSTT